MSVARQHQHCTWNATINAQVFKVYMEAVKVNNTGHHGFIPNVNQCRSMKIRFQNLIPMSINKDQSRSLTVNVDLFSSIKFNADGSAKIGIDLY